MADILLSKCAQFREEEKLIDVRLKVGEQLFPAHRIVLAANSDYFNAMFTNGMKESKQEVIELKDESISAGALKTILDSMYSGDLRVSEENAFDVFAAANHLQITNVVDQCCDFLNGEFVQDRFDLQRYCQLSAVADRQGSRELRETVERKMASMYKEVCDNEEFLSQISADQLLSLLSRDDLSAPSETFVFKSVMRWIKYKKEERLQVAAKVIEAVRLGLVDVGVLIEELNTEEIQRVPEIHKILIEASLYFHAPSQMSKFAEKTKPRAASTVLVAIKPKWSQVQHFDVETKRWKPLPSMAVLPGADSSVCTGSTAHVGNDLYVAANDTKGSYMRRYNIDKNVWEKLPHTFGLINNLCRMGDYMYAISSDYKQVPQRYSFAKRQWQSIAKVDPTGGGPFEEYSCSGCFYNGAVVFHSKLYVFYGCMYVHHSQGFTQRSVVHCFDESRNQWVKKWTTGMAGCFGSRPFVVNDRLYIAGGWNSLGDNGIPKGEPSGVYVYDEQNDEWSVVEQNHIPPNNLGAVEIEGRVYFIINKFPVDSGIRIPPGEVYPVCLGEWENLGNVGEDAALCYLPLKESMKD